jgi:hypothetical protein
MVPMPVTNMISAMSFSAFAFFASIGFSGHIFLVSAQPAGACRSISPYIKPVRLRHDSTESLSNFRDACGILLILSWPVFCFVFPSFNHL